MTRFRSTGTRGISLVSRTGTLVLAIFFAVTACRVVHGEDAQGDLPAALETAYLPPDTSFAILLRPAELSVVDYAQPVVDAFDELLKPAKLGISVADIDAFKFVLLSLPDIYMVIRAKRAIDWKKVFGRTGQLKEEKVNDHTLYTRGPEAFWLHDDRTVVFGTLSGVQRAMENPDPNDRADWSDSWEKAAKGPLAGLLHMRVLDGVTVPGRNGQPGQSLAPLTENAKYAVLKGHMTDKGLALVATIAASSNEGSVAIAPVLSRVLTDFASMIVLQTRLEGQDSERLAAQLTSLLGSTQIGPQGKTLEIKALVTPKMLEVFAESAQLINSR